MYRYLFFIFIVVNVFSNRAQTAELPTAEKQKVLLLTSLDMSGVMHSVPWFLPSIKKKTGQYNKKIENKFREHFNTLGFEVEAYHYVDQSLFWQTLVSGEYVAIYWVSHGSQLASQNGKGTQNGGGLFDYRNYEITALLRDIHPNLKVLATIGCFSSSVAKKTQTDYNLNKKNPELYMITFDNKIDTFKGLDIALKNGTSYLNRPHIKAGAQKGSKCRYNKGLYINLTRKCVGSSIKSTGRTHLSYPAIRFEANDKIIATLGPCAEGEQQKTYGHIPIDLKKDIDQKGFIKSKKLKIVVTSGARTLDRFVEDTASSFNLGKISVDRFSGQKWQLFSDPETGTPIGFYENIFHYRDYAIDPDTALTDYHQFSCYNTPSRP